MSSQIVTKAGGVRRAREPPILRGPPSPRATARIADVMTPRPCSIILVKFSARECGSGGRAGDGTARYSRRAARRSR